jgi:hypothetical protein
VATGLGFLAGALIAGDALCGVGAADGSLQLAVWLAVEHPAMSATMQIAELITRLRGTCEHDARLP